MENSRRKLESDISRPQSMNNYFLCTRTLPLLFSTSDHYSLTQTISS